MEKLLTVKELAVELRCRPEQIYRLLSKQNIPCVPVGARKRFLLSQVIAYLQHHKPASKRRAA